MSLARLNEAGTAQGLPATNPSLPFDPTEHAAHQGTIYRAAIHICEPIRHPKGKIQRINEVCIPAWVMMVTLVSRQHWNSYSKAASGH